MKADCVVTSLAQTHLIDGPGLSSPAVLGPGPRDVLTASKIHEIKLPDLDDILALCTCLQDSDDPVRDKFANAVLYRIVCRS